MKRRLVIAAAGLAIVIAGLAYWRCGADRGTGSTARATGSAAALGSALATAGRGRLDPRRVVRGSLAGTITDQTKAPIPKARVCAEGASDELAADLLRDPSCATADDQGRYKIENVLPARYVITAAAKPFRPAVYQLPGPRRQTRIALAAGEHKTGLDIALRAGGVEITGTVADLTGGPIASAKVRARGGWEDGATAVFGEADERGAFSLWVAPGSVRVSASAEGYADAEEWGHAPGAFELVLAPESLLSGTVVDGATSQPVEGARVTVRDASDGWGWDSNAETTFTDDQGRFRVARLTPGRKVAVALTDHGYGQTDGSVLVGLGQHVDGVVVKLFPAVRVEGTLVVSTTKAPCEGGAVQLTDPKRPDNMIALRTRADGTRWAEGVLPGTYRVTVTCDGYQARDKYAPITVADKDLTGLVWEVDPGAALRGRVLTKSGEPVEGAVVGARSVGGGARDRVDWGRSTSAGDGQYELAGLTPGSYQIEVETDRGTPPKEGYQVDVPDGATVTKDLVLEDAGTIKGTVVDAEGKPVAGVRVSAQSVAGSAFRGLDELKSDRAGAFTIEGLRAGEYRVLALGDGYFNELRKPGTTDDAKQGERVTVRANQTATVKLVVEARSGTIKGTVVDAAGAPVNDAYISVARESDAAGARESNVSRTRWSWGDKPVLTGVDGAFTVGSLTPGKYTVRAYRKGGGEAVAEHVATGSTTRLQIKPTGSIEGTVKRPGAQLAEFAVDLSDAATAFHRRDSFYMTRGRFTLRDLPQGHYRLTVEAQGARKEIEIDLAEGEAKTGVTLELEGLITITGRVVEHGTTKPVPGIQIFAVPGTGNPGLRMQSDEDRENITDDAGRFRVENVPTGQLSLFGAPKDYQTSAYGFIQEIRTVDPKSTDVGDLSIFKRRVKQGDPEGELGVNFAEQPSGTPPEKREKKVSYIDPAGPAAKTELRVGDIVVSIDGIDITGVNAGRAWSLLAAPPGARLALGLQRGATVAITLVAP